MSGHPFINIHFERGRALIERDGTHYVFGNTDHWPPGYWALIKQVKRAMRDCRAYFEAEEGK